VRDSIFHDKNHDKNLSIKNAVDKSRRRNNDDDSEIYNPNLPSDKKHKLVTQACVPSFAKKKKGVDMKVMKMIGK